MKNKISLPEESIKTVPLHTIKPAVALENIQLSKIDEEIFATVPTSAKPLLVYNGGVLLENVAVYTIFWGQNWYNSAIYKTMAQNINYFFSTLLNGPLMDQLAEYNTLNHTIGYGSLSGTKTITKLAPLSGTSITDTAIQNALTGWINAGTVAPVSKDRLYFIYTDINVKVIMGGSASCTNFCGYHNSMGSTYYAVMPFPSCAACLGGLSAIDALTGTSSHELCEAITDPIPGSGWYDPINGEIGDICAWKFKKIAGYTVQMEWSNKAENCV